MDTQNLWWDTKFFGMHAFFGNSVTNNDLGRGSDIDLDEMTIRADRKQAHGVERLRVTTKDIYGTKETVRIGPFSDARRGGSQTTAIRKVAAGKAALVYEAVEMAANFSGQKTSAMEQAGLAGRIASGLLESAGYERSERASLHRDIESATHLVASLEGAVNQFLEDGTVQKEGIMPKAGSIRETTVFGTSIPKVERSEDGFVLSPSNPAAEGYKKLLGVQMNGEHNPALADKLFRVVLQYSGINNPQMREQFVSDEARQREVIRYCLEETANILGAIDGNLKVYGGGKEEIEPFLNIALLPHASLRRTQQAAGRVEYKKGTPEALVRSFGRSLVEATNGFMQARYEQGQSLDKIAAMYDRKASATHDSATVFAHRAVGEQVTLVDQAAVDPAAMKLREVTGAKPYDVKTD